MTERSDKLPCSAYNLHNKGCFPYRKLSKVTGCHPGFSDAPLLVLPVFRIAGAIYTGEEK